MTYNIRQTDFIDKITLIIKDDGRNNLHNYDANQCIS